MNAPLHAERRSSRDALLQAAAKLMTERESTDVSLSDIAQQAKLNAALVKYYFGSKNGLMLALVEDVVGRALIQMRGLVDMDLAPVEKLKLHIKGVIGIYFRHPFINRLIHLMLQHPETARQVTAAISRPLAETQRQLLEAGLQDGVFKAIDPMHFYFIILGACDHLFFGQQILHYAFDVEEIDDDLRRAYTDTLVDLVLHGMLKAPA